MGDGYMKAFLQQNSRDLRNKFFIYKNLYVGIRELQRDLPELNVPGFRVKASAVMGLGSASDVELRRIGNTIHIGFFPDRKRIFNEVSWRKLLAFYYWYINCDKSVGHILVNSADGDKPSAAKFSASSFHSNVTTLPDPHFFLNRGYRAFGELAQSKDICWNERSDEIIWRGSLSGNGYRIFSDQLSEHPGVNQRIRFAQKTKNSEIDFKFVLRDRHRSVFPIVISAGLAGDRVTEESWAQRKYAIDIDGYSNAWSNLFIRLKLGCCVFKVDSDYGFRQWYYDRLKPFEHYIPIKADLSDLFEQVEWAQENQGRAQEIAATGQALVDAMTFETETAEAVRLIEENWNK